MTINLTECLSITVRLQSLVRLKSILKEGEKNVVTDIKTVNLGLLCFLVILKSSSKDFLTMHFRDSFILTSSLHLIWHLFGENFFLIIVFTESIFSLKVVCGIYWHLVKGEVTPDCGTRLNVPSLILLFQACSNYGGYETLKKATGPF